MCDHLVLRADQRSRGSSPEVFRLLQFAVGGKPVAIRRTARAKTQILTVNVGEAAVTTLSYTYRTLVQQNGHLLHLDISQPTKGLHVEFSYGDCGIRYVNVLDYIAGARQPGISQLPASDPTPSVEVGFDGWMFPKDGLAFVWVRVLEGELTASSAPPEAPSRRFHRAA